jgi:hypothetical protein
MCTANTATPVYNTEGRLLGYITIRPGIVAPGELAAVQTPDGFVVRRIYYEREGEREFVRLVSALKSIKPVCYPLADVTIKGELVCRCDTTQRRSRP